MSAEAISSFWKKVDSEAELQKKLFAKGQMTLSQLVAFAGEQGYTFTADELKSAADAKSRELSEKDLKSVVGGVGTSSTSLSIQNQISRLSSFGSTFAL